MTGITLRPYQLEAIEAIRAGFRRGIRRPLVSLPTGVGKTVIFSSLASRALARGNGVLVLAHRDELLSQAADKMRQVDPALDDLTVGLVKASADQWDRPARVDRRFELIIVDECFPAGTLVGDRPIEEIRAGEYVPSWDEETGHPCWRPVLATSAREAQGALVRITFEGGEQITCTEGHPVMTRWGWLPAGYLETEDETLWFTHHADANDFLYGVRIAGHDHDESEARLLPAQWSDVLLDPLPGRVGEPRLLAADEPHEPDARERAHAAPKPDATTRAAREDARNAEGDRARAARAGRQREAPAGARAASRAGARWVGADGRLDWAAAACRLADALQDRPREPREDDRGRDRRGIPLLAGPPRCRSAEGLLPALRRVERIEVLERRGDGRPGGGREARPLVYNLTVAGTHTYRAGSGLVVHNCHHAAADSYQRILTGLGAFEPDGPLTLGVTATPQRADSLGLEATFQEVVYHRDILSMIRAGYLCELKGRQVTLEALDLTGVKTRGGDYVEGQVASALEAAEAPHHGVRAWLKYAKGRKTIVFTPTIALAHEFAEKFRGVGVQAAGLSGETPRDERRGMLEAFKRGDLQVICNAQVLTEGFDEPSVECIVIARPTKSQPLYVQMIGRGTRPFPGKEDCLVMDLVGATDRLDLTTLPRLFGLGDDDETRRDVAAVGVCELAGRRRDVEIREGRITAREVELFKAQKLAWAKIGQGEWVISTPAASIIVRQTGDLYRVERRPRVGLPSILAHDLDLGYAQGVAEDAARSEEFEGNPDRLLARDAPWRKRAPGAKQIAAAKRLRIRVSPELSAGELSDLMAAAIARRRAS